VELLIALTPLETVGVLDVIDGVLIALGECEFWKKASPGTSIANETASTKMTSNFRVMTW
jgi:hypothetical protein